MDLGLLFFNIAFYDDLSLATKICMVIDFLGVLKKDPFSSLCLNVIITIIIMINSVKV